MPSWVQAFCGAFLFCFALGGYEEYKARRELTEESYLTQVAAAYFLHPEDPHESRRSFIRGGYQYWCRGEVVAEYSMTANAISLNQRRDYSGPATKAELTNFEIISLITGLSAAEVITQIRVSGGLKKKELASAIIGAVSGYNLGRWTFSRTRPSCDSKEITRRLGIPAFGPQIGREIVQQTLDGNLLMANGQTQPLAANSSLEALERVAAAMPEDRQTWIPAIRGRTDVFLALPRIVTSKDLDAVCKSVRALLARLAHDRYAVENTDFQVAMYPHFIAKWLSEHRQLASQAFPGFQGVHYTRDPTEDPRMAWLRTAKAGPLGWLAYGMYVLMFAIGAFVLIFGMVGIFGWLRRVRVAVLPAKPQT